MNKYVEDVIRYINVDRKTKKRIIEDLTNRIDEAQDHDPYFDPYTSMGSPEETADEFKENLNEMYPSAIVRSMSATPYEYKSKFTVFGLPLLHINTGGTYGTRKAKGIIAVGDFATGIISVGGVSIGVISIGGIGLGLATIGGIAIGGIAVGGVAIGGIAIGGVAYALAKSFGAVVFVKLFGQILG